MQRTLILSMLCLAGTVAAQGERLDLQDDVPLDTYLALLAQVAPPARDGAEAYMAAFRSRCGRALRTIELRRAFAQGNGGHTVRTLSGHRSVLIARRCPSRKRWRLRS